MSQNTKEQVEHVEEKVMEELEVLSDEDNHNISSSSQPPESEPLSDDSPTTPRGGGGGGGGSKNGFFFRAKKNISSKFVGSKFGKKAMEMVLNEETMLIISSTKTIITRVEKSSKLAERMEKNIVKLLLKGYFQYDNGNLSEDDLERAHKPLLDAFLILIKLHDNYYPPDVARLNRRKINVYDELKKFESNITDVKTVFERLLKGHIRDKNMERLRETFDFLGSAEFLHKVWTDETIEDDLFNVMNSIQLYTQMYC